MRSQSEPLFCCPPHSLCLSSVVPTFHEVCRLKITRGLGGCRAILWHTTARPRRNISILSQPNLTQFRRNDTDCRRLRDRVAQRGQNLSEVSKLLERPGIRCMGNLRARQTVRRLSPNPSGKANCRFQMRALQVAPRSLGVRHRGGNLERSCQNRTPPVSCPPSSGLRAATAFGIWDLLHSVASAHRLGLEYCFGDSLDRLTSRRIPCC